MRIRAIGCAGLAAGALFAIPATGHHSHAMFDDQQTFVREGSVAEFQWTNPHSWLRVEIENESGEIVQWALELGSPANLARRGWRPRMLAPGDPVTVTFHPLKDGNPGGALLSITLPDGTQMGDDEYIN